LRRIFHQILNPECPSQVACREQVDCETDDSESGVSHREHESCRTALTTTTKLVRRVGIDDTLVDSIYQAYLDDNLFGPVIANLE